ncbi:RNA-directed DNA polymerase [Methanosarcina sp.]|uniref:RNA-directed DNA polymerase n=1 Tax=Methanosarcina sp. TaxID=2213 RepID=UPI002ABA56B0|nr:RNA-directed DNA polymerase [Methanosarcina sp.]MDY9926939.1 RNA-directed DNA polymerase [Methanosarcina sp.]
MDLINLLRCGYFPKELPPPFSTEFFATNFFQIESQWPNENDRTGFPKIPESIPVEFSIPKKDYIRRKLSIPNPVNQSYLSKIVCENWDKIETHCNESRFSLSIPVENIPNDKNNRAIKPVKSFIDFRKNCIIDSFDKIFELKVDISWFYPSIYTHSIPWALHTKEISKQRQSDMSLEGNVLDKYIRKCQSNQTNGIPIGPDTSLVLAEIVACSVDKELGEVFSALKGYRYYDDYYFYFSKREEAEEVLKHLQYLLNEFQLSLNEKKTIIIQYPYPYDTEWALPLRKFQFRMDERGQERDIWKYFNLAFDLYQKNIDEPVLKYTIRRIEKYKIYDSNWELFQSLILKCTILDPKTIKNVIKILLAYPTLVDVQKVTKVVYELLNYHCNKNHSYEVAWALWLAKTFNVNIINEFANYIFSSNDIIPIVIALDLKKAGLINSDVNTSCLVSGLTKDSLHGEKWLLTYESVMNDWLQSVDHNILDDDPYFKVMKDNEVNFYDQSKQITPVDIEDEVEEYTDGNYTDDTDSPRFPDISGMFFGFDDYD